jgi:hypothetical protein
MLLPIPTAEEQLHFLSNIQRVFAEGDFTATYKYAVLISFADLAVELGAGDGRELVLSTRQIGERFIQMYWHQALTYAPSDARYRRPPCRSGTAPT